MNKAKKILLVYSSFSTFVEQDYKILSEKYSVDKYHFIHSKKPLIFFYQFFRQLLHLLIFGWKYDAFFIWFADFHSLFPVLFAKITGKKSFIVIGGYDVCRIPSLKYGAFYKKYRGFFTIQSIKKSTLNLTVSNYVDRKIKYIAPKAKKELIYNCIEFKNQIVNESKEDIIITVGSINNEQTFYRKGIDTFIEVARSLQQFRFQIIGIDINSLSHILINLPPNLSLEGKTDHDKLVVFYSKARVYCQFSRMDTFCLTLAEAMYFNCIPVITNIGGMPEVAGSFGVKVKRKTEHISKEIITMIARNSEQGLGMRKWITDEFSTENREKKIFDSIS